MADNDGFDDLLTTIGFGRWQATAIIATVFIGMQLPVHLVGSPLLNAPVAFHCSSTPLASDQDTTDKLRSTGIYSNTYFNNTCLSAPVDITAEVKDNDTNGYLKYTGLPSCPYIQYDSSIFTSTVVSQWHLVCEQSRLQPLFQMMYNIGGLFGSTLGGHVGDRFGRKRAIVIGCIVNLIAVALMASVPYYPIVLATRVLAGVMSNVMLLPAWSLALESSPSRHRSLVGMLLGLPYSFGVICIAGFGYFIRSWQYLLLVCATPAVLLLPIATYLDESPRWLVQQERLDDATKVLKKAVKLNNAKLTTSLETTVNKLVEAVRSSPQATADASEGPLPLLAKMRKAMKYLHSPGMRIILLMTPTLWFLQSFLYLSVAINANNFTSTDPFLYVALTGVMDGSAIILSTPLATRLGRKIMIFSGMFIGAILFLLDLIIPVDYYWAKWVLVMAGFLLVAASFQVSFVYAPELFPTEARTRGFALVNLIGNIGFICAPIVTDIMAKYTWWAGGVFFGCAGILGSLTLPFLPETRNKPLPETLQDVEERRNKSIRRRANAKENKGFEAEDERSV